VRWRHFVGGWVGHKTGLDAVEKRKFSSPCWESNSGHQARRYTKLQYSWGVRFESRPGHRISWGIYRCFLSNSREILG
jgi:hypothetical protein